MAPRHRQTPALETNSSATCGRVLRCCALLHACSIIYSPIYLEHCFHRPVNPVLTMSQWAQDLLVPLASNWFCFLPHLISASSGATIGRSSGPGRALRKAGGADGEGALSACLFREGAICDMGALQDSPGTSDKDVPMKPVGPQTEQFPFVKFVCLLSR
jgi:hypothetical protein